MYVRAHKEYTNGDGEDRILIVMQDNEQDELDMMLATKSQSEKIGTISVTRGTSLEKVERHFPLGLDLSAKYQFGAKVEDQDAKFQGKLYEIDAVKRS